MKLTKNQLKAIIREELEASANSASGMYVLTLLADNPRVTSRVAVITGTREEANQIAKKWSRAYVASVRIFEVSPNTIDSKGLPIGNKAIDSIGIHNH